MLSICLCIGYLLFESSNLSTKGKRRFYICVLVQRKIAVWVAKKPDIIGLFAGDIFFVSTLWRRRRDSNSRTPLRVTRFPIVRARPATRLLRVKTVFTFNSIELYHIAREKSSTISFFLENIKIPRRAGGVRRDALPVRRWRRVRKRYCARRIPSRRGAKIVRACARSTGLPQLSARHAEALPYSFSRSCTTVSVSPYTVQLQPPARHSKEIVRTASGAAAVRFRPPPLQPQPALYRRRAARPRRNACISTYPTDSTTALTAKAINPLLFVNSSICDSI